MNHPAQPMRADPIALQTDSCVEKRSAPSVADEFQRNRRILIVAGSDISARVLGDAFRANAYEVLETSHVHEAIGFASTHNPGVMLLMLPSLTETCNAVRRLRPYTSTKIIAFSANPVTATERDIARRSGCDDYRDAFLRTD